MTTLDLIDSRRKTTIPRIQNYDQLYAHRLVLVGEFTRLLMYPVARTRHQFGWAWGEQGFGTPREVVLNKLLELLHNLTLDFVLLADAGANQEAREMNLASITKPDFWELAWQEDKQVQEDFEWRFWGLYDALSYLANQESDRNTLIVAFVGLCKYFGFSQADVEVRYQALCEKEVTP